MFIKPSFKKSLIVEQFQGNYFKSYWKHLCYSYYFSHENFQSLDDDYMTNILHREPMSWQIQMAQNHADSLFT